ncbi:MAG: NADPH-dependent F420 reductase [Actinobacteria bacterium]|nr:NADPH-dependent F420 reductase [Actinomycetota bacterium]
MNEAPVAPDPKSLVVGVLGGTGDQGRGLASRLGQAGVKVLIGGRDAAKASQVALELQNDNVRGTSNSEAANQADLVIVAVPWAGHAELLKSLANELSGKVVIDCVNPLGFDKQGAYALPVDEGSACLQAAAILPQSRVVGAFHHISASLLLDPSVSAIETDVLVIGDDREATDLVQSLVQLIPGMRGIYGGRLRNSHQVEAMTANLISINKRYKAHAGLRVTDV